MKGDVQINGRAGKNKIIGSTRDMSSNNETDKRKIQPIIVRNLCSEDLTLCFSLGYAVAKEYGLACFEPEIFRRNWEYYIDEKQAVMLGLFVANRLVGMLGGVLVADLNSGILTGQTLLSYVRRDYRTCFHASKLLIAFEQWAYTHGANIAVIKGITLTQPRMLALYEERGYKADEVLYVKRL